MDITVSFPISVLVHSSLVMRWSSWNSASTFGHFHRCHGWSATVGHVTNVLFMPFKMTDPASNWANINSILTIHTSQMFIGLEPSAAMNSVTSLYLIHTPTMSTILHSYCFYWTWFRGVPVILMELDSVTIKWVRLEVLPDTFPKKIGLITFVSTFIHTRFHQNFFCFCLNEMYNQTDTTSPNFFHVMNIMQRTYKNCIRNLKIVILYFVLFWWNYWLKNVNVNTLHTIMLAKSNRRKLYLQGM